MKKSLSHLPQEKREELKAIVNNILLEVPETQVIILYGSYARGNHVEYDQRTEYRVRTFFKSDYDIAVITEKSEHNHILSRLERVAEAFSKGRYYTNITPIQFITENIDNFNQSIVEGRYFHTDIRTEGIQLYNSGKYKIARKRKLNFTEIHNLAQEYYEQRFERASSFVRSATHAYNDKDYKTAAFLLHQATENYLCAILLTGELYCPKEHSIMRLFSHTKRVTRETLEVFHSDTKDEERLLLLLEDAYIQARYNPDFEVKPDDIFLLFQRIKHLTEIAEKFCSERIEDYAKRIKKT